MDRDERGLQRSSHSTVGSKQAKKQAALFRCLLVACRSLLFSSHHARERNGSPEIERYFSKKVSSDWHALAATLIELEMEQSQFFRIHRAKSPQHNNVLRQTQDES